MGISRWEDARIRSSEDVIDLRSAIALLASKRGHLQTTDVPVDPYLEIPAVYKLVGAGTPVAPPTKVGPAMIFENPKGFESPVVTGILASRERVALLLGSQPESLCFDLLEALRHPVEPEVVGQSAAPCQEVVIKPPFDLRTFLPATTSTKRDAGPFINMGLIRAEDADTGESDVTIHRLCIHGPDTMTVNFTPGRRHIDAIRARAEQAGRPLPLTINLGLDPAIHLGATFEPPTTPFGFDELTVAGGIRRRPVELVDCVSVEAKAIARAEIVLECEIMPGERADEDAHTGLGFAMPEYPGYVGLSLADCPVVRVRAITHRKNPLYQTLVGPGEEHVSLCGIPTETSIYRLIESSIPGLLKNVYCHSAGGGRDLAVLQIRKRSANDEGRQRQAALIAFASYAELKQVILVDDDVDPFDSTDVLWAMTSRFQGDVSTIMIPGVRCHLLDPSATPEFNPLLRGPGISCKTIFDCTVPYALKEQFRRADFETVDLADYLPESM